MQTTSYELMQDTYMEAYSEEIRKISWTGNAYTAEKVTA